MVLRINPFPRPVAETSSAPEPTKSIFPWPVVIMGAGACALAVLAAASGVARPDAAALGVGLLGLMTLACMRLPGSTPHLQLRVEAESRPPPDREPPYAQMLEDIADPLLLIAGSDPHDLSDRRFVFANAASRELWRIQRQEGPLTTAVRAPEVLTAVEDALFGAGEAHAIYQSRGAQERFWRVRVHRLRPSGFAGYAPPVRLALLSMRDETEVRRSERTRADFLANASHELRTPLASLAGFVETLRGHARDDQGAREKFLAIMQVQAERMRGLIDDLMSLSRIELSEHIRPSGAVDLTVAVGDVLDALAPQAAERRVSFAFIPPKPGPAVAVGDRDQIVQVIQNLVENAVKYSPDGGEVGVEVIRDLDAAMAGAPSAAEAAHLPLLTPDPARGQRYVALRVRDRGRGIARNHLPRLTERFYRVEGQRVRDRPGTGLGLAIVKHIINRHRGGLTVDSAEGAGSTFTVYIPMAGPETIRVASDANVEAAYSPH
jgi:two-component system phosphate regulon sensor histidine kinase PhoR